MAVSTSAGVGVLLNPSLTGILERTLDRLDYLATIPDRGWVDQGVGSPNRFQAFPQSAAIIDQAAKALPVVLHGIGLSICSAELFDKEYVLNLVELAERYNSPWVSEHLAFSRVGTGHEANSALLLPVPYDLEVLDLLTERVRFILDRLNVPFLLENNVYYFKYPEEDLTEEQFLNRLCSSAGCGVLLDLHNLYTNAVNHGFEATDYLNSLELSNVVEIHIAGGLEMMGYHTDSHTGPVPDPVWKLLEQTLPRTPSLKGVTFEFHESSFDLLGESGVIEHVERARELVGTCSQRAEVTQNVAQNVSATRG